MPPELVLLVGILLRTLPILVAGTVGVILFSRSTLGKAVIRRLQEGGAGASTVAQLQAEVDELRRELGEVQERLDFTEHRLRHQPEAPSLSRPETPSPPDPVPTPGG